MSPKKVRMKTVKEELATLAREVEVSLQRCLKNRTIPSGLLEAMEYSLLDGGKRLRPALCLCFAEAFGLPRDRVMGFACGLECIHTYSLIHDDLPAMDDDDLRRGRPSNHKAYGEATAILTGDALLTEAFGLMSATVVTVPAERVVTALAQATRAAGAQGMVGGQVLDMEYTGKAGVELEELRIMHAMKTGALIQVSCVTGAILAGAREEDLVRVRDYGAHLGVAFQIADDILDEVGDEAELGKPVGSDREQGKNTYPALVGLVESRRLAEEHAARAQAALAPYSGQRVTLLRDLVKYVVERTS